MNKILDLLLSPLLSSYSMNGSGKSISHEDEIKTDGATLTRMLLIYGFAVW